MGAHRLLGTLDLNQFGLAQGRVPLVRRFSGHDQRSSQRPRRSAKLTVPFECWDTDEPSERGIDGIERMRLVRDDIADRVADLCVRMQNRPS